ncbi:MAG: hypothetical protein EA417_18860 [Gammaproteobacteria bacterium]|nr:MAG: hypothetical protein EA417_18860 [Gammaproteobacteria bacterium]
MSAPVRVNARIEAVTPLGAGVREIRLRAEGTASFLPGQYLQILHPDGTAIPFSIASAPQELPAITLHYLAQPDSEDATRVESLLTNAEHMDLLLPCGDCGFTAPLARPLLALAGGSGIAQIRSLLRTLLPGPVAIRLYWGAARTEDLYLTSELDAFAAGSDHFTWYPVAEQDAADQRVRQGRVGDVVAADVAAGNLDLSAWQVLIAGGPPMVWGTIDALRPCGLTQAQTFSDVLSYAPRDDLWS